MKKALSLSIATLLALVSHSIFAEGQNTGATTVPTEMKVVQPQINLLNINTATAAEIQDKLVGIGPKKAQAIVDYREKNGQFVSIEQLTEVAGIGQATLDKNRDRIIIE